MIFVSCHGDDNSDIYQSGPYVLVRTTLGFGIERATILYDGVRVHQIERQDGLDKAMTWCRNHQLTQPVPELDLPKTGSDR